MSGCRFKFDLMKYGAEMARWTKVEQESWESERAWL